jgi:hypothetical protein
MRKRFEQSREKEPALQTQAKDGKSLRRSKQGDIQDIPVALFFWK